MIGYLEGTAKGVDLVVCGGVGYRVMTPAPLVDNTPVALHVVPVIREDAFELFGFPTASEEELFRLLIRAKGVGPRVALALLGHLGAAALARAINADDAKTLATCKGVGIKLAQTLCLSVTVPAGLCELLGVDDNDPATGTDSVPAAELDDLSQALVSLGYAPAEAISATEYARRELGEVDEGRLLRAAIGHLSPAALSV